MFLNQSGLGVALVPGIAAGIKLLILTISLLIFFLYSCALSAPSSTTPSGNKTTLPAFTSCVILYTFSTFWTNCFELTSTTSAFLIWTLLPFMWTLLFAKIAMSPCSSPAANKTILSEFKNIDGSVNPSAINGSFVVFPNVSISYLHPIVLLFVDQNFFSCCNLYGRTFVIFFYPDYRNITLSLFGFFFGRLRWTKLLCRPCINVSPKSKLLFLPPLLFVVFSSLLSFLPFTLSELSA